MKPITRKQGESQADYLIRLRKEWESGEALRIQRAQQKKDHHRRQNEARAEHNRQRAQRAETLTTLRQMFPVRRPVTSCARCGAQLVPLADGGERYCPECQEVAG